MEKVAVLVDGGYFQTCYRHSRKEKASPDDVIEHCNKLLKHKELKDLKLLRIFYYDCMPYDGGSINPVTKEKIEYSETSVYDTNLEFIEQLKQKPNMAVRMGMLSLNGWRIKDNVLHQLISQNKTITSKDIIPDFKQKGVDMKIGLDIARMASKQLVDTVVLVTGDKDFVPAMKFARREGLRVMINTLDHKKHPELREHSDFTLTIRP
jgi:uncharacterized LabA/DUF88 family protein